MRLRGALLILATACMFGLGAVLAKIMLLELNASLVAFMDLALGFAFLAVFLVATRTPLFRGLTASRWRDVLLASTLGTGLPLLAIVHGLGTTTAVKGGFLIQLQSPAAVLFAVAFLRERISARQGVSIVVLLAGAFLVVDRHAHLGSSWTAFNTGDILVALGALGLGFGFVPARRLAEHLNTLQLSGLRLLIGAGVVLPGLMLPNAVPHVVQLGSLSSRSLLILLLYVFTNFCLAYVTLHAGLRLLRAWEAGAILQTMSLFSTIFAILLLGEPLTFLQAIGGLGVILGGFGVAWAPR